MKFLIVDDEHELYKVMFADILHDRVKNVHEIPKFNKLPRVLKLIKPIIFNDRINRHCFVPGKSLYNKYYSICNYKFKKSEKYWIIFLNGTLNSYYSKKVLMNIKTKYSNVRLALIMYDHFENHASKRVKSLISVFDHVFSFDPNDCEKYNLDYIFSTFSTESLTNVRVDKTFENNAEFVGTINDRENIVKDVLEYIGSNISNCKFYLVGVNKKDRILKPYFHYHEIPYNTELMLAYNSNCIVELLKKGQQGISLRTCEALLFNKKLITNNPNVKNIPGYDPRFIKIINSSSDIDLDFIQKKMEVDYHYDGYFSPRVIVEKLKKLKF